MKWREAVLSAVLRYVQRHSSPEIERRRLIDEELSAIVAATNSHGATPEQTLSKVLQDLRDDGVLRFKDGMGTYVLLGEEAVPVQTHPPANLQPVMFVPGQIYRRRDLHEKFKGQQQGGISTPANLPIVLLFTGESGHPYGYDDEWTSDQIFLYTGEGQEGDMVWARGNLAIRNHVEDGKDLHLFQSVGSGDVKYIGQMIYVGHHEKRAPDAGGKERTAIVFELSPLENVSSRCQEDRKTLLQLPTEELREKALSASTDVRPPKERLAIIRDRSQAIRAYALKRAGGQCEACNAPAPFKTPDGEAYLESHHLRRLSDDGPDHPEWVAGICPNCHRRIHFGGDGTAYNQQLTQIIQIKEH